MRDLPSAVLAWAAAALGICLAALAAQYPYESAHQAAAWLAVSSVITVQLLAFTVSCYTSRFWLTTHVSASAVGPGQQEPKTRRGLPALKSNQSAACGLDVWSLVVVLLVVLPIAVPLLSLYRPSAYMRSSGSKKEIPTGITQDENGVSYTTGAYEAIDLAFHSKPGPTGELSLQNSAGVYIDRDESRVVLPSQVPEACNHDEVRATNLKAVIGQYNCKSGLKQPQGGWPLCKGQVNKTLNPSVADQISVYVWNSSCINSSVPWSIIVAQSENSKIDTTICNATYFLAWPVEVVWRGKNKGYGRVCQIAELNYMAAEVLHFTSPHDDMFNASFPEMWSKNMSELELPFRNAFQHAVDPKVTNRIVGDKDYFFGSIFAAATIIRATSAKSNPGKAYDDSPKWTADQTFATVTTYNLCFNYGWSAVILVLIIMDVLLAAVATVLSSRQASQQLAGLNNDAFSRLFSSRRLRASAASGVVEGTTSSALASFNHSVGVPVPSKQQLGPGTPRAAGREPHAADAQQAGLFSQQQQQQHPLSGSRHGPGAQAYYPPV